MNQFDRGMIILTGGLRVLENDPGFTFRAFQLPNAQSARFFRMSSKINFTPKTKPPVTGLFVEARVNERLNQISLMFCSHAKGSDGSTYHTYAELAYDPREVAKGRQHIADFLMDGKIPVADEEYATEE